jgi:very-short-patch-repair endonuclease
MTNPIEIFIVESKDIRTTSINNQKYASVYDVIRKLTGNKNVRDVFSRIKNNHIFPECVIFKFPGQGQNITPVMHSNDINKLLSLIIPGCRMSLEKKNKLLEKFELKINPVLIKSYIEEEIHHNIISTFYGLHMIQQYPILDYRIDLYFPEYKIAIECDEHNHSDYSKDNDKKRQQYITNALNCNWIRYNPYSKDFDIFQLLNSIFLQMGKCKV